MINSGPFCEPPNFVNVWGFFLDIIADLGILKLICTKRGEFFLLDPSNLVIPGSCK